MRDSEPDRVDWRRIDRVRVSRDFDGGRPPESSANTRSHIPRWFGPMRLPSASVSNDRASVNAGSMRPAGERLLFRLPLVADALEYVEQRAHAFDAGRGRQAMRWWRIAAAVRRVCDIVS